jgi:diacylglycerol O-acyltransferase / wax synthase
MDRMSPLDASFLHIEDENSHMHIGSVAIFDGPPPGYDEILRMVRGKLPLVPRYRQKVRMVPFDLGRPVWIDDAHFHLEYHVRHTALPKPGSADQLRNLVGRVMGQQLDRSRPLWSMWVVEGLEDDRWALVSQAHHCLVDGISGTDLLAVLLDLQPSPSEPVPDHWQPRPEPGDLRLLGDAAVDYLVTPLEQMRGLRRMVRTPRQSLSRAGDMLTAFRSVLGLASTSGLASLNGPIGPHRRYHWARGSLADVKAIRKALGGTVNDVVLAAITRGFRDLLISRGAEVEGVSVRTMVPVSVRAPGERGTYNNRVSAMFAELPVGIEDPGERLDAIRAQMEGLKDSKQAVAGEVLTSLSGFAPPMLLSLGTRTAMRFPQNNLHTVTTNVPGPQFPLYAAGRQMREAFPYVPIAQRVRIGVAIFSYLGTLNFGVTGDYDTAPDIDVLTRGFEAGIRELLDYAGVQGGAESGEAARTGRVKAGNGHNGHGRTAVKETEAVAKPARSRAGKGTTTPRARRGASSTASTTARRGSRSTARNR